MRYRYLVLSVLLLLVFILTIPVFSNGIYNSEGLMVRTVARRLPVLARNREELEDLQELRVMVYNIRYGKGLDGVGGLDTVAEVIREADVDLVGLNEVDVRMFRTGMRDQARYLADRANMNSFFVPSFKFLFGQYGNGLLSRHPIVNIQRELIPRFLKREPRVLAQTTILLQNREVHVIVTHLGLNPVERQEQLDFLAKKVSAIDEPLMVLGDFNSTPTSPMMRKFLKDTGLEVHSYDPTYPANNPTMKIDYILTSPEWEAVGEVKTVQVVSSDHLPIIGTFRLREEGELI